LRRIGEIVNRESLHRESTREQRRKTSTFEDLEVHQVAREFRKKMYQASRQLPEMEKFGLIAQIRRAALSLTNNIAEGHGRYHFLDQIKFMLQSRGSLEELIDDLNTCEDEDYLAAGDVSRLKHAGWRVRQLIDGYIRYLREQRIPGGPSSVRETSPLYGQEADLEDDSRFTM
jgi:four helix bundle protein